MSLSTYSGLVAAIPTHMMNNTQLTTAVCQDMVTLAEAQINRRLRVRKMVDYETAIIDGEYSAMPEDYAGAITLQLSTDPVAEVKFRSQDEFAALAFAYAGTGQPRFYTVKGVDFRFLPIPDDSYTAKLTYYQRIPALSDASETNWLLDDHPDVYLYGALFQAACYLKDQAEETKYATLFQTVVADVMLADKTDGYGGRLAMRGRAF